MLTAIYEADVLVMQLERQREELERKYLLRRRRELVQKMQYLNQIIETTSLKGDNVSDNRNNSRDTD